MKLTFLGTGSFFSGYDINHTNLLFTSDSGKNLLLDCSSRIPLMLEKLKIDPSVIDAVYISHMHDDHAGGLEWLAFYDFFVKGVRPDLFCHKDLMDILWEKRLQAAAGVVRNKTTTMDDFFRSWEVYEGFIFDGIIDCILAPVVHVENGSSSVISHGLEIKFHGKTIYWTSDMGEVEQVETSSKPRPRSDYHWALNCKRYCEADIIIQDCELGSYPSRVHVHYNTLRGLPGAIKKNMLLCHYGSRKGLPNAKKDGFMGFAKPGQVIKI
jgi:hypothetical protein